MIRWLYSVPRLRGLLVRVQSALFRFKWGTEPGVRVFGWPVVRVDDGGLMRIGARCVLISESVFSEWGLGHPVHICVGAHGRLTVGDDVGMSGVTIVCRHMVTIGSRTMLGANVCITDTDSHPVDAIPRRYEREGVVSQEVWIGDDVFIGANAIVLKGSSIGDGSVIGAGSVVSGRIPQGVVAAGNPARVIRRLVNAQTEARSAYTTDD